MLERKEEKQIKKFVKNNNDVDFTCLGYLLIGEFLIDLAVKEVDFLKNIIPGLSYTNFTPLRQNKFRDVRDYLIEVLFSRSVEHNKILKQKLFEDVKIRDYEEYTFKRKFTSMELKRLQKSKVYTKTGIKNELARVHDARRKENSIYCNMSEKAFFENLTEEEKKFADVNNQEQYDWFLERGKCIEEIFECYNDSLKEWFHKYINDPASGYTQYMEYFNGHWHLVHPGSDLHQLLYNSRKNKLSILNSLKEHGVITNDSQELYFKKALDKLIITKVNYNEIKQEFLGDVSSHKK